MFYKILLFSSLISIIIYLSYQLGKTKKQLTDIKIEKDKLEKEIVYVQETTSTIYNFSPAAINERLQQIVNKKK